MPQMEFASGGALLPTNLAAAKAEWKVSNSPTLIIVILTNQSDQLLMTNQPKADDP